MSHYSSMEEDHHQYHHKEMQLISFPTPHTPSSSSNPQLWSTPDSSRIIRSMDHFQTPSLDLQLSISVTPLKPMRKSAYNDMKIDSSCVDALKWQAAEQIRLAAMEKAYAERMRELTRREMELAQSEFARARSMWERAREEVDRAEKMKEKATWKVDSGCMEITCQSCRQKFRP